MRPTQGRSDLHLTGSPTHRHTNHLRQLKVKDNQLAQVYHH